MTVNINRINTKNRLAVLIAAVCICACTVPGTLLTGASTAGLAALSAPGLAQRFDDAGTIISINRRLLAEHDTLFLKVNIDALAGRVLLTGTVPDERAARLLEDLARDTKGVRHVTSRVVISAPRDFGGLTQDSFIRTRLKTKLMSDGNVSAVNFVLRVHRGVIYILGIAPTRQEGVRVVNHARALKGVEDVVLVFETVDEMELALRASAELRASEAREANKGSKN